MKTIITIILYIIFIIGSYQLGRTVTSQETSEEIEKLNDSLGTERKSNLIFKTKLDSINLSSVKTTSVIPIKPHQSEHYSP